MSSLSSLRFSHNLFKAAHRAIMALACAMTAFVASAQPSNDFDKQRLRWLSKFPADAAIPLVFGQSSNESFWIVDPTEPFSRRLLKELFRDGPQKLTGKVYIYLRPLQTTDERASQMTAYIWCSPDRAERLKEVLSDDFSLPSKPNKSCDTRAIQKILRNTSDLNFIPLGLHAQGIVKGTISVSRLADIERAFNLLAGLEVPTPNAVESTKQPSIERAVANRSCRACHSQDRKIVGPSWSQLASSYGTTDVPRLAVVMTKGNKGRERWGNVFCPGDSSLSEVEALRLAALLTGSAIDNLSSARTAMQNELSRHAQQAQERIQRQAEARAERQATAEVLSGVASVLVAQQQNLDAMKARTREKKEANRQTAIREAEYRARLQRGESGQSDTKPAGQMSAGMSPGQTNAANTAGQMHSGSARDMGSSTRTAAAGSTGRASNKPVGTSKFISQDATTCVEIVPPGFKCGEELGVRRYIKNICAYKISVTWRVNGGLWGMDDFSPGRCRQDSPFDSGKGGIEYRACSWDPKAGANYGPFMTPNCHY